MYKNLKISFNNKLCQLLRSQEVVRTTEYVIMFAMIVLGSMVLIGYIGKDISAYCSTLQDALPSEVK